MENLTEEQRIDIIESNKRMFPETYFLEKRIKDAKEKIQKDYKEFSKY